MSSFNLMDHHLILWPMAAMAGLTFVILSLIPMFRVGDVSAGRVSVQDFQYGESERVPDRTKLYNRNYMNLLELPVLFYVVGLILFINDSLTPLELGLAWAFVLFRTVHSVVHLTLNRVTLRLSLFSAAVFSLMALWIVTFWHMAGL
ncbi:MAG TPA: MAPEG family protein [Asticcacaulis sp.]|nr:MAPEG family protein [Asticcacaulis sp.]